MSDRTKNIDTILHDAATDLRIPTEAAQMILRIGAELAWQHQQIVDLTEELQQIKQRNDTNLTHLAKRIDRLAGVHGA